MCLCIAGNQGNWLNKHEGLNVTSKPSLFFSLHHALAFTAFVLAKRRKMHLSVLRGWTQPNEQKWGTHPTPTHQFCARLCNENEKSKVTSMAAALL